MMAFDACRRAFGLRCALHGAAPVSFVHFLASCFLLLAAAFAGSQKRCAGFSIHSHLDRWRGNNATCETKRNGK